MTDTPGALSFGELIDVDIVAIHADTRNPRDKIDQSATDNYAGMGFIGIEYNSEMGALRFLFEAYANSTQGYVSATVAPVFGMTETGLTSISNKALDGFLNEVAAPTALPYLRLELADASRRVFSEPVTLPLAPKHGFSFSARIRNEPSDS
ncbi:hypothetical protein NQ038_08150 [Brevibacterium sp. 50QC2O2]|uniref:hypothetical protein n=1 Tax=Brevibacterium sp. 50QC2O2 TaxID=2968459 RepID=UPI00211BB322|nr:hypothetical protein [Brevibacterium sp. 50QC2O2]MCQ9388617.1 hypothetical protein [Brevibacterium sp. 50QC2O2]